MRKTETYPISDLDFKYKLLKWAQRFEKHCFLNSNDNYYNESIPSTFDCLAGVDSIEDLSFSENSFDSLKSFYESNKDWLFGYLSYDLKNETEQLESKNIDYVGFPLIHFFKPRFVFEVGSSCLNIHHYTQTEEIDEIFNEILKETVDIIIPGTKETTITARVSKNEYISDVNSIKEHIVGGDVYELNYCQEFYCDAHQIDPYSTYFELNKISPTPFSCFYKLEDKFLISASPERFLKKVGQKLISQPIKGTIRRGSSVEEDIQLKNDLKNDPKEKSENIMIVDLVRNDLARTAKAGTVKVEELFGIYTFSQVHQMISTITSELNEKIHFIDAIKEAFPMGSMTGAPKIRAMKLIEKFEKTKRGLYSGAIGYITPSGDFDFNVVIRSLLYNQANKYISFMVGSAITASSVAEKEYEECLVKAAAILKVLNAHL